MNSDPERPPETPQAEAPVIPPPIEQQHYAAPIQAKQSEGMAPTLIAFSIVFLVIAAALAIKGLYTLYDDSFSARIVGGDAYNFIIYAGRGTAQVCAGIVSAVIGATLAIFALIDTNKSKL